PTPPPPPAPPAPPTLSIVVRDTRSGDRFEAKGGRIRIGRGDECELRPVATGDTSVSRVHAEIVLLADGRAVLRDAKSRNGTLVNDKLLAGDHPLKQGERVKLGEGGPDLMVEQLVLPGAKRAAAQETADTLAEEGAPAGRGEVRRSFAGKGKTVFFREMMEETTRKSASRLRVVVWTFVGLLAAAVGGVYWFTQQRVRQTTAALEEQRQAMLAQQAQDDSVRRVAAVDYERLRQELEAARSSSAPAAVLDSLRQALTSASRRTEALEGALRRAESQMAQQIAAGDSVRRAAQSDLSRLRSELNRATSGQQDRSNALLDSLRNAIREAERKAASVDAQMRGLKGVNLPALAQSAGGAVGLVTAFAPAGIFDGSGFALTLAGYFVTNRHVAQPEGHTADSLFVTMNDQQYMVRADLYSAAPPDGPDVAILKIRNYKGPVVPRVDWTGTHVRQGEPAALIGFPAGASLAIDAASGKVQTSMSAGIFSKVTSDRIQFDGFTVGGSSGSPIFNADGDVVALHRAGLKEAAGLGFAVPIQLIVPYLPPDVKAELGLR
ncbi:MAG: trypsin-like peptidase domain-containing protein, partial [Gemmatimonadetes bacterium]|nr:trypsin-like peptidase domain-containing protein [Gemmatimonadota bacterium]